ncbi:unnamed protein product [Anisakis simplex]|uniref:Homeobox domain-containing protein n=1 Tax=Anisakis simplex TaxID=6269 RepID=A0A158PNK8_ANISI|nr:unnamed protein product [Anisakis simplex]
MDEASHDRDYEAVDDGDVDHKMIIDNECSLNVQQSTALTDNANSDKNNTRHQLMNHSISYHSNHSTPSLRFAAISSISSPTSSSVNRPRPKRSQSASATAQRQRQSHVAVSNRGENDDEFERRAMAEAAFNEWLRRKSSLPRGPRCSPSRDQIEQHLREDARHRVLNIWLARPPPPPQSAAAAATTTINCHNDE